MLDAINETLRNKVVSTIGASGLVVSAEATKAGYIDLASHGFWGLAYPSWMQLIGCLWICILILEKVGLFKFIAWAFRKLRK